MAGVVAKSYSEALFSLAIEEHALEDFKEQLLFVETSMEEHPDFLKVLYHPKIHKDEKKDMLKQVYGNALHPLMLNFLLLLIDKGRIQNLCAITKAFIEQYNKHHGIVVAYIKSARSLSDDEVKRMRTMLEKKLDKKIDMRFHIDADVLAGVRIKIGDKIVDNTAKNRLERMKEAVKHSDLTREQR